MKTAYIILGAIVLAAAAGAAGFFAGTSYAQAQAQNTVADFARQRAIQAQQGNAQGAQTGANANNPCGFVNLGRAAQGGQFGQSNAQPGQGNDQFGQANAPRGQFGGFGGLGAQLGDCVAAGQIKSVDGDTVQISTADKVVTVQVNDQTIISKTDRGTIADLQPGDRVIVFSKETGDNPTASGIQLQRPITQPQQ